MICSLIKYIQTLLAGAVVLAAPAYAVCSLLHGAAPAGSHVTLTEGDDPIRNGLRVVDQLAPARHVEAAVTNGDPEVILLTDWMFTSKGKPSPYQ